MLNVLNSGSWLKSDSPFLPRLTLKLVEFRCHRFTYFLFQAWLYKFELNQKLDYQKKSCDITGLRKAFVLLNCFSDGVINESVQKGEYYLPFES